MHPGLFLTLTLRHNKETPLTESLSVLLESHRKMLASREFRNLTKTLGVVGNIKAVEITYGIASGWHPHLHIWMITDNRPFGDEVAEAEKAIFRLWKKFVAKVSDGTAMVPNDDGLDLRRVTSQGIGGYIAKYQADKESGFLRSLPAELARGDLKTGKNRSATVPFEFLDLEPADKSDRTARFLKKMGRELWLEYYYATWGKRSITWSPGLREKLGLNEKERKDIEIINDTKALQLLYVIDGEEFDQNRKGNAEYMHDVLTEAEHYINQR